MKLHKSYFALGHAANTVHYKCVISSVAFEQYNNIFVVVCVQRLSSDCEDQIRVILQESALDYRLDPQLQMHCTEEVSTPAHQNRFL